MPQSPLRKPLILALILFWTLPVFGQLSDTLYTPVFSHAPGYYASHFQLEITTRTANAEILYTLDGSTPDETSARYSGSILMRERTSDPNDISLIPTNTNFNPNDEQYRENWSAPNGNVFKANVVRARTFVPSTGALSDVVTMTYLVTGEGASRFSMPVVSIVTDRENLFDPDIGIYVPGNNNNYFQRGEEWERPANISLFEADGLMGFQLDAGIRIHGNTSRNRPRKSIRIYARGSEYGTAWIEYSVFPDKNVSRYKRLLLRNSGNDWSESVFRDAFMHDLVSGKVNIDVMYARPAIVLINGEYWGIHDIRDRFDHHYTASHYGVDEDDLTMIEGNLNLDSGTSDGIPHYQAFRDYISSSSWSGSPQQFDYVQSMIDVSSFIDFQIVNIFYRNTDWPGNHEMLWRYNLSEYQSTAPPGRDGRWRWMIFDLDFGLGLNFSYVNNSQSFGGNNASHNTLAFALASDGPSWPNPPWSTLNLRRLSMSESFRHQFVNRFADLLNTTFKTEHTLARLNDYEETYRREIEEHIDRWGRPKTVQIWDEDVSRIRSFLQNRRSNVEQHIRNQFLAGASRDLEVSVNDVSGGYVHVNSLRIDEHLDGFVPDNENGRAWKGRYFQHVPVRLIAETRPGYRFTGWTGSVTSTSDTLMVNLTSNFTIGANFERIQGDIIYDSMNPEPWTLVEGPHILLNYWGVDEPEGSFPRYMSFQQTRMTDPGLRDEMTDPYFVPHDDYSPNDVGLIGFPYQLSARTRINARGEDGISMINTGRGRDLGAVVLAAEIGEFTMGFAVHYTVETVTSNNRRYALRLQYRYGIEEEFQDVIKNPSTGEPVEYIGSDVSGHTEQIYAEIPMPYPDLPAYVQLRWKYYYTGERRADRDGGARDEIGLKNIYMMVYEASIEDEEQMPKGFVLRQNYPNPFNPTTRIEFEVPDTRSGELIRLSIYDLMGREVARLVDEPLSAGRHAAVFDGNMLSSGVYIYRMYTSEGIQTRKLILLK